MTSFTGTPRECLADLSEGSRFHELTAEGGAAFYFFYVSSGPYEVMSLEEDWMDVFQPVYKRDCW